MIGKGGGKVGMRDFGVCDLCVCVGAVSDLQGPGVVLRLLPRLGGCALETLNGELQLFRLLHGMRAV